MAKDTTTKAEVQTASQTLRPVLESQQGHARLKRLERLGRRNRDVRWLLEQAKLPELAVDPRLQRIVSKKKAATKKTD